MWQAPFDAGDSEMVLNNFYLQGTQVYLGV